MWPNPQEIADLVTFTAEILDGKLLFLCSEISKTLYHTSFKRVHSYLHNPQSDINQFKFYEFYKLRFYHTFYCDRASWVIAELSN